MNYALFIPLIVLIPGSAFAGELDRYLNDELDTSVRLEVFTLGGDPVDDSFFSSLLKLIGIRKATVASPSIGTTYVVSSSAYAPSPYQTDATPCITAVGTRVRPGVVASNFLPIGTILKINGEHYIVEDRMNPRFRGQFIDIWFPSTSQALQFGRRKIEVTVVGYGEAGQDVRGSDHIASQVKVEPIESRGLWQRVREGLGVATVLIGVRQPPSVDRYDVDCLTSS